MEFRIDFKDRIRMLRKLNGISTTKLAGTIDLSEAAVKAWELGRTKPNADTLIKLAEYFDCTTDYLLGISDVKNESDKDYLKNLATDNENMLSGLNDWHRSLFIKTIEPILHSFRLNNTKGNIKSGTYEDIFYHYTEVIMLTSEFINKHLYDYPSKQNNLDDDEYHNIRSAQSLESELYELILEVLYGNSDHEASKQYQAEINRRRKYIEREAKRNRK